MGQKQTRKQYTKQFKLDVIARSYQRDNIRELALELGLAPALIYKWRAAYGNDGPKAFPGKGVQQPGVVVSDDGHGSGRSANSGLEP